MARYFVALSLSLFLSLSLTPACAMAGPAGAGATPGPEEVCIYGGGPLYSGGDAVMDDLRGSGFTTVVAWTLHVDGAGDLSFNDQRVVAGGRYVGDPLWPPRLAGLKRGGTVHRLLFAVGSAGAGDFHGIQALVRTQGTGPDSRLGQSFQALKQAIPAIDGFDLDDEDLLDPATTKAFSAMLGRLGWAVTFCPYDQMDFWVDCLHDLEADTPGLVTGFHLQCYAGGAWNQPQAWMDRIGARLGAGFETRGFVQPGLWGRHGDGCQDGDAPGAVAARFGPWKDQGVRGGFIWLYDDLLHCRTQGGPDPAAYAAAIAGVMRREVGRKGGRDAGPDASREAEPDAGWEAEQDPKPRAGLGPG